MIFISCKKESSKINNNNNNQYTKPLDSCFYVIWEENNSSYAVIDTFADFNFNRELEPYNQGNFSYCYISKRITEPNYVPSLDTNHFVTIIFNLRNVNNGDEKIYVQDILNMIGKNSTDNSNDSRFLFMSMLQQRSTNGVPTQVSDTGYVYDSYDNLNYFKITNAKLYKRDRYPWSNDTVNYMIIEGNYNFHIKKYLWTYCPDFFGSGIGSPCRYGPINSYNHKNGKFRLPLYVK